MRRIRSFLVLMAMSAAFGLLAEDVAFSDVPSDEAHFVALMNHDRAGSGLPGLQMDGSLIEIARRHSQRMASSNSVFHNGGLTSEVSGLSWSAVGENVGRGGSVSELHGAFMASPTHRANVLGSYDRVGVGIVMSGATYYVTEVFMKSTASTATTVTAKRCRKVKKRMRCTAARKVRRKKARRR